MADYLHCSATDREDADTPTTVMETRAPGLIVDDNCCEEDEEEDDDHTDNNDDDNNNDDDDEVLEFETTGAIRNTIHPDGRLQVSGELVNAREQEILKASKHVKEAMAMRTFLNDKIIEAKNTRNEPQSNRVVTLVTDFAQNGELPSYSNAQPGETFYYSPLTINIFGIVDGSPDQEELHAYCYEKFEGKKGGNNVASLIMEYLHEKVDLNEKEPIKELNIVMDNCSGQNKNNMVLRLAAFLVDMEFCKKVTFAFLVVGHTKNHCDRLFNLAKKTQRSANIFSMGEFVSAVAHSDFVFSYRVKHNVFRDWGKFLDTVYKSLSQKQAAGDAIGVKKWQLFTSTKNEEGGGEMTLRSSALPDAEEESVKLCKRGTDHGIFFERMMETLPVPLKKPGLHEIKQVELYTKYRPLVPPEYRDKLCRKPSDDVIARIKKMKSEKDKTRRTMKKVANALKRDTKNDDGGVGKLGSKTW